MRNLLYRLVTAGFGGFGIRSGVVSAQVHKMVYSAFKLDYLIELGQRHAVSHPSAAGYCATDPSELPAS